MSVKLRKAVTCLVSEIEHRNILDDLGMFKRDTLKCIIGGVKNALAEPVRNCDKYTADELKAIFSNELVSELPIANEHEKNLVTITAMGVIDTLFATAEEGGSDGSK